MHDYLSYIPSIGVVLQCLDDDSHYIKVGKTKGLGIHFKQNKFHCNKCIPVSKSS